MCFPVSDYNPGIRMKPRYTDAFWGEHPFDGDMVLIENKNKNMFFTSLPPGSWEGSVVESIHQLSYLR